MELIERYLYAVGKKLPLKQKDDILKELRSIIMDNLDDLTNGNEPSEEDVTKVLKDRGSPNEVAKSYRTGPSWIVGPKYYDLYMLILKILLAVTAGGYLLSLIISAFSMSGGYINIIVKIFVEFFGIIPGLLTTVGTVTLIFFIIERAVKEPIDIDLGEGEKWSPSKLEPIPKKEEVIKPIEPILGIVFSVFVLLLINAYRAKLGIYYLPHGGGDWASGEWAMIDILNAKAMDLYVPIWSAILALNIGLYGWQIGTGKRNISIMIFELFISALNIGVLFYIANGPILFKTTGLVGEFESWKIFFNYLINNQHTIFTVLAVISIIGFVVNLIKLIIKYVKSA